MQVDEAKELSARLSYLRPAVRLRMELWLALMLEQGERPGTRALRWAVVVPIAPHAEGDIRCHA